MDFITVKEAADRLKVSPSRVLALIKAERLPAEKVGGIWLIKTSDLARVKDRRPGWPKGRPRKANP